MRSTELVRSAELVRKAKPVKLIVSLLIILLISAFIFTQPVFSKGKVVLHPQTYSSKEAKVGDKVICPVLGEKFTVKKDSKYAEVKGKKYYVCCPMCIKKIKKDPDKYLKDKALKQTFKSKEAKIGDEVICPVMGEEITVEKKSKYVEINKKKYYVCCPMCIDKIKKNPEKYLKEKSKKKKMEHMEHKKMDHK